MANDDMPVLFCKILIYLYKVLKGKKERDEYYIQPMTADFPIDEHYLQVVLLELRQKGYIRGSEFRCTFGGNIVYDNIEITYDGVIFLRKTAQWEMLQKPLKRLYLYLNCSIKRIIWQKRE